MDLGTCFSSDYDDDGSADYHLLCAVRARNCMIDYHLLCGGRPAQLCVYVWLLIICCALCARAIV